MNKPQLVYILKIYKAIHCVKVLFRKVKAYTHLNNIHHYQGKEEGKKDWGRGDFIPFILFLSFFIYIYIYIERDLFIYIKRPIAVCYASIAATAFPSSAVI